MTATEIECQCDNCKVNTNVYKCKFVVDIMCECAARRVSISMSAKVITEHCLPAKIV